MANLWFPVDQPDPRFRAEGRRILGPFYEVRVWDAAAGRYVPLHGALLTGLSSVHRAVKYGIERYHRTQRR